ncbi:hypothetical protein D3C71_1435130 [compost metagenome]
MQRATERGGNAGLKLHVGRKFVAQRGNGAHLLHHFFRSLADVGQGMRAAGGDRHGELVYAGPQRGLGPAQVGHQRHHRQTRNAGGVGHDLGRVRHLRQQAGRHERRHLDLAHAGRHQRIDPTEFVLRGHGGRHRLQTVARAHFADQYLPRVGRDIRHDCVSLYSIY